jgi:hypothetical protein
MKFFSGMTVSNLPVRDWPSQKGNLKDWELSTGDVSKSREISLVPDAPVPQLIHLSVFLLKGVALPLMMNSMYLPSASSGGLESRAAGQSR